MCTESIVSKKIVIDHIICDSVKPHNLQISWHVIILCNVAYSNSKYKDSLIADAKAKAKHEKSIVISEVSKVSLKHNEILEFTRFFYKKTIFFLWPQFS